jgi:hypothetical protein
LAVAIVAGALANKPRSGGEAWVRMSWVLGLRRLGFDVCFAERLSESTCVDGDGRPAPFARSINRTHLQCVVEDFELAGRVAVLDEQGHSLHGLDAAELRALAGEANVLFDLSGHLGELGAQMRPRLRVFVDLDPGFTQAWHADRSLAFSVSGYDRHVTVGQNVGSLACPIPSGGLTWIPTLPPIPLERWRCEPVAAPAMRFTTVSTWRAPHGAVRIDGRTHLLKHHQFRRLIELPARVERADFELALEIDAADEPDRRALREHGWRVVSARRHAGTPAAFRHYVQSSSAEFSVAHGVYAETASGWFSDRTGAYLASGRPALVQDTGLGATLPIGEGLLTFDSTGQAAEGALRILADPRGHAQAARRLAEQHLDSDVVFARLLAALGLG